MNTILQRFISDERGAEMVEWAVVTIVLLSFTVVAVIALKGELIALYQSAFNALQEDPPDNYDS